MVDDRAEALTELIRMRQEMENSEGVLERVARAIERLRPLAFHDSHKIAEAALAALEADDWLTDGKLVVDAPCLKAIKEKAAKAMRNRCIERLEEFNTIQVAPQIIAAIRKLEI